MLFRLSIVLRYFTKHFMAYNLVFTAVGLFTYWMYGPVELAAVFWTKVIGYASIVTYFHFYKGNTFLFFNNIHLTRAQLLVLSILVDIFCTTGLLLFVDSLI